MMNKFILLLIVNLMFLLNVKAQHLYPEKFTGCNTTHFCLDCGNPKAEEPISLANEIVAALDKKLFGKLNGKIEVQILIDENGIPCLLSASNSTVVSLKKLKLQEAINGTSGWKAAISEGKAKMSSISFLLEFNTGSLLIKRKVFNFKNQTNMSSSGTPEVKGTDKSKLSKAWTLYNQQNSELPWDMTRAVTVDHNNKIWIGTDNGIVTIQNDKWSHYNSKNTIIDPPLYNKNQTQSVRYATVDKNNNKWFIIGWDAYKFDDENWTKYDSINSPINWARKIFVDHANNVWFTSWNGVAKFDGKNWTVLNTKNSQLPSDKTLGVFVDKSNKLWIGTFKGNVVIENGQTRVLDEISSPLSKAYISQMYEDTKGNLWFSLYNDKSTKDQGIYILNRNGKWTKLKLPNLSEESSINEFLIDEDNDDLWINVNGVGVFLYDLNTKNWEIYINLNSNVPSIHAEQIAKDKEGNIWIATYSGVIKSN